MSVAVSCVCSTIVCWGVLGTDNLSLNFTDLPVGGEGGIVLKEPYLRNTPKEPFTPGPDLDEILDFETMF